MCMSGLLFCSLALAPESDWTSFQAQRRNAAGETTSSKKKASLSLAAAAAAAATPESHLTNEDSEGKKGEDTRNKAQELQSDRTSSHEKRGPKKKA